MGTTNFDWQSGFTILGILYFNIFSPVQAQIIPDDNTSSSIRENVEIKGQLSDLIIDGKVVGNSLFHSFQDFNVTESQRVYFENHSNIENILMRVTGTSESQILGTLGVDGLANLYLSNENGFVFGENAVIDVEGSFTATTGNIQLNDNKFFGKGTNIPNEILDIQVPLGIQHGSNTTSSITSRANLEVPGNLILNAENLDLEGQVRAGENLELRGANSVKIRDSETKPFIASAGQDLLIQGNQDINISALNHKDSDFASVNNMTLRSQGAVRVDTHPWMSGGNFRVEQLTGELGHLLSPNGLVIRADGDVSFESYRGASLDILAGGQVLVSGLIEIADIEDIVTDPDNGSPNTGTFIPVYSNDFANAVGSEWSDNSTTDVNPLGDRQFLGSFKSDLITLNLDNLPKHESLKLQFQLYLIKSWDGNDSIPDKKDDDVWQLSIDGDQYSSYSFSNQASQGKSQSFPEQYNKDDPPTHPALTGASEVNTLGYTFRGEPRDSVYSLSFDSIAHDNDSVSFGFQGLGLDDESWGIDNLFVFTSTQAPIVPPPPITPPRRELGSVVIAAADNIELNDINTSGGLLNIKTTGGDIILRNNINTFGGDINIDSAGSIDGIEARIQTTGIIEKDAKIKLHAQENILLGDINSFGGELEIGTVDGHVILSNKLNTSGGNLTINSGSFIDISSADIYTSSITKGGTVDISANKDIILGSIRSSGNQGAGDIRIFTPGNILSDGHFVIRSDTFKEGFGGKLDLKGKSVILTNGSRILTGSEKGGVGGDITIDTDLLEISGVSFAPAGTFEDQDDDFRLPSLISTTTGNEDDAGNILINTKKLIVKDGAIGIGTATVGPGNAGTLIINASESVELFGITSNPIAPIGLSSDTVDVNSSSGVLSSSDGNAGDIFINTKRLVIADGAVVSSSTFNSGRGGSVSVKASDSVELNGTFSNGFASGIYAQSFASGDAGDILVDTAQLLVQNGATITARTETVGETNFPTQSLFVDFFDVVFKDIASGNAGNINVEVKDLNILNQGSLLASSSGAGDSGSISINAQNTVFAQDGDIQTLSRQSSGGLINLTTSNLRLLGDSDITTSVFSGAGGGGDIIIRANSILAFDDSDILAFARDGKGGNIFLITPAFFGENYQPAPFGTDPETLDLNGRVDINATGLIDGALQLPDLGFIDNSLTDLPDDLVDTDSLLSQSCFAQSSEGEGKLLLSGSGGLPVRPGDMAIANYSLENILAQSPDESNAWDYGDPVVEATAMYEVDGRFFLLGTCS